MKKLFLAALAFLFTACATTSQQGSTTETIRPVVTADFAATSVQILEYTKSGGGSGVIYRSNTKGSTILTNRHVCMLTAKGGWVLANGKYYAVDGYKPSQFHDVCFVHIKENLGVATELAKQAPELYSAANISGHPNLLPHVRSKGDWSEEMVIQLVVDMKPCTEEDLNRMEKEGDFGGLLQCIFLGGIPVTKDFDAQLVTGLILPGSSGSAVFDNSGRIAGLAFASASRDLHYALVVPYRYVKFFVTEESVTMPYKTPVLEKKQASVKVQKRGKTFRRAPLLGSKPEFYDYETWQKLFNILDKRAKQCQTQKVNCLPVR